jgi:hypothetical protein
MRMRDRFLTLLINRETVQHIAQYHLLPVAGYILLTIGVTYPTAFRLTTHIPGGGDAPWFLWQLWWFKRAIVDLGQSPLITGMIYYPLTDVPVTWQTPINEFLTIPLQMATGVVVLYNVLFLSSFVLSGYFMYLLVARIVGRRDLAFVGGLIFAFCAYRGVRGLGHLSLLTTQWMPLCLLLLINCWRRPTILRGLVAGLGVGLVALSSPYYAAYFLLPVALVGSLYVLIWRRSLLMRPSLWSAALVAVLAAGVTAFPFYASFLDVDPEMTEVARSLGDSAYEYGADLLSWLLPSAQHPLWGRYTHGAYSQFTTPNLMETTLFFGFLAPLLAIISAFMRWPGRRQVVFWQILTLLTLILAFGPVLHIQGQPVVEWLPYRLFMALPGAYAFRIPSRIGITTVIAATVLAMMVLERWMKKRPGLPWRAILAVWSAMLLFNLVFQFPYPTSSVAVPPAYQQIAQTPGEFAILELPAGERFFGQMSWYMYYQTYHQKPLVSGYLGRRPPRLHVPEQTMPFVQRFFPNDPDRLVALPNEESILAQRWPEDIRYANKLLDDQGIRYVLLHCQSPLDLFCRPASSLLNMGLGLPVYQDETTMLYSVSPVSVTMVLGLDDVTPAYDDAFSEPFVLENGYTRVVRDKGTISFTLPRAGKWIIQGELEGELAVEVQLTVDGETVPTQTLVYSETLRAFSLRKQLQPGSHDLVLDLPSDRGTSGDKTCGGLCVRNLTVRLENPMAAETATAQEFEGLLSLTHYSLQEFLFPDSDGPQYALITRWSCQNPISEDYTLYVHYVDGSDDTLAQDDHLLGRSHLEKTLPTSRWTCPGDHTDISLVPQELVEAGDLGVALGLWIPETGQYLQSWGELPIDQFGRTRIEVGN